MRGNGCPISVSGSVSCKIMKCYITDCTLVLWMLAASLWHPIYLINLSGCFECCESENTLAIDNLHLLLF
jgi:hypothetical protein